MKPIEDVIKLILRELLAGHHPARTPYHSYHELTLTSDSNTSCYPIQLESIFIPDIP